MECVKSYRAEIMAVEGELEGGFKVLRSKRYELFQDALDWEARLMRLNTRHGRMCVSNGIQPLIQEPEILRVRGQLMTQEEL